MDKKKKKFRKEPEAENDGRGYIDKSLNLSEIFLVISRCSIGDSYLVSSNVANGLLLLYREPSFFISSNTVIRIY